MYIYINHVLTHLLQYINVIIRLSDWKQCADGLDILLGLLIDHCNEGWYNPDRGHTERHPEI